MEIELKFKIHNVHAIRVALEKAGAEEVSFEHEQDFYFDDKKRTLRKKVIVLRVRKIGDKGIFTVKTGFKKVSKRFKVMNEIEVPTNDFYGLRTILETLGYRIDGFKEKYRHTYRLHNVNVLIDRLPFLGSWLELEGKTVDISAAAKQLKLNLKDSCSLSYGQLFSRFVRENAKRLKTFRTRVDLFSFECEKKAGIHSSVHI